MTHQGAQEIPFDCAEHSVDRLKLSYLDSGGEKPPLHFFHANGFPVSVYLPLMTELARDFRVVGLSLRGQDGLGEGIRSWHRLAEDLIGFLDTLDAGPVFGVGHSIGAVSTLFAAVERPDLFRQLVLLDPVLPPPPLVALIRVLKLFGRKHRIPLAVRARGRRNGWADRQEALEYFRSKSLFRGWTDAFLHAYVSYGLRPDPEGRIVLVCPPEAEAQGFENYPTDIWAWPKRLRTPTRIVRGERSDALRQDCYERFLRNCPAAEGTVLPGTDHFIPMQQPDETVALIRDFCR